MVAMVVYCAPIIEIRNLPEKITNLIFFTCLYREWEHTKQCAYCIFLQCCAVISVKFWNVGISQYWPGYWPIFKLEKFQKFGKIMNEISKSFKNWTHKENFKKILIQKYRYINISAAHPNIAIYRPWHYRQMTYRHNAVFCICHR